MNKIILYTLSLIVCFSFATEVSNSSYNKTKSSMSKSSKTEKSIKKGPVTHVKLTCYQPVKEQCDAMPLITSDGSKIDLKKLKHGKIKWCAISRDLLWLFPKDKPKMIHIDGYGIYEVKDVMNKRFSHRVDILIHPSDEPNIMDENVKVTILV